MHRDTRSPSSASRRYNLGVVGVVFLFCVSAIVIAEGVFRDRFFSCNRNWATDIAYTLASGSFILFLANDFHDKCVVAAMIDTWSTAPEVVAIGSSRTMQLRANLFPQSSFYNASVFAARLPDYMGLVELMDEHGKLPKTLIIGLDAWSLDGDDSDPRWGGFFWDSTRFLLSKTGDYAAATIYAVRYAEAALKRIGGHFGIGENRIAVKRIVECGCMSPFEKFEISQSAVGGYLTKAPDGSITYQPALRTRTDQTLAASGQASAAAYLKEKHSLSPVLAHRLWRLVDYLSSRGTQPIFWLAAYSPLEYAMIISRDHGTFIPATEVEIRSGARQRGLHVIGSYDPAVDGCKIGEFVDWQHPAPDCIGKAFSKNAF